ncbi:tRNA glutamyl-Q(34) synthetase GluQRS [Ferrimonas marina]|uniref:Glutamyl-Q tRNA(Asp) synthetase n=1 Tax=Ferrimonas marina TaxID=299255 RepID=A0A1M5ZEY1_9GAMM|nr:tRNA glutamyl-Q(34) synthetase GluQRS [Ferrimonas marina]SHI22744.1 glutamyl-Q tRNA(Asp) synthetase [Ferrimonas marina]
MSDYIGRFAPSPSGPLHFGSLVAAVGSYLRARHQGGRWLVRMEDLDPPREVAGAADTILRQLDDYGLHWDGEVLFQSQRHDRYEQVLAELQDQGLAYRCDCTRKRIKAIGGVYDGHCRARQLPAEGTALRLRNLPGVSQFDDALLGPIHTEPAFAQEDFILKRRDGLYAYQLAVVLDDHDQGVTEVVRGNDLLEATVRQLSLYQQLGWQAPTFLHLPLAVQPNGNKLSKQNHARAIEASNRSATLARCLAFLRHPLPTELTAAPVAEQLHWAVTQFDLSRLPQQRQLLAPEAV